MSPVRLAVPPIPSSPRARIAFSMFSCPCRSCEWQCTNNLSASLPATLAALVVPSRLSRLVSRPRLAREERTRPKRHDFFVQHRLLLRSFFWVGIHKSNNGGVFSFQWVFVLLGRGKLSAALFLVERCSCCWCCSTLFNVCWR